MGFLEDSGATKSSQAHCDAMLPEGLHYSMDLSALLGCNVGFIPDKMSILAYNNIASLLVKLIMQKQILV